MVKEEQKILMIGLTNAQAARLVPVMTSMGFTSERIADSKKALALLRAERYAVVLATHPLASGAAKSFLSVMRSRSSRSISAGLALFAPPERIREAKALIGLGVNRVMPVDESPERVANVVKLLANPRNPLAKRHPAHLELRTTLQGEEHRWLAEDISAGGLLVRAASLPKIGTRFDFTLIDGDRKICGQAKVVRHTDADREALHGFGARFCTFADDGRIALAELLRRLMRQTLSTGD